mgnify:CR=1 FL=1
MFIKPTIAIKTLRELKTLTENQKTITCFVTLNGSIRSYKDITRNERGWWILNRIDGSQNVYLFKTGEKLEKNIIYKAMRRNALYLA